MAAAEICILESKSEMPFNKTIKYVFYTIVSALILVLILFPHVTPYMLNKIIQHKIIMETGIKDFHINIRSVGLFGAEIGNIKIGKTADIDSIYINYRPGSLLRERIDGAHISGLVIRADLKHSKIEFPDTLNGKQAQNAGGGTGSGSEHQGIIHNDMAVFAALPGKILVTNSSFVLNIKGRSFRIPFGLSIINGRKGKNIRISAHIFPFGERVDFSFILDPQNNIKKAEIKSDSFCLEQIDKFISMYFPGVSLSGTSAIKISGFLGGFGKHGNGHSLCKIKISHIGIRRPYVTDIDNFISTIELKDGHIFSSGSFMISRLSLSDTLPNTVCNKTCFNILSPVRIDYSAQYDDMGNNGKNTWKFSIKAGNRSLEGLLIEALNLRTMHMIKPEFHINLSGNGLKGRGNISGTCIKGRVQNKDIRVPFQGLKIKGQCHFNFNEKGKGLTCGFRTGFNYIRIINNDFYSELPGPILIGEVSLNKQKALSMNIEPVVSNALLRNNRLGIKIKGIHFDFPLRFPFKRNYSYDGKIADEKMKDGIFSAAAIVLQGHNIGNLEGRFIQKSSGCTIKGRTFITGAFKPNCKPPVINFVANASIIPGIYNQGIRAGVQFNTKKFIISSDMIKAAYLNPESGISFHGSASMKGFILFDSNELKTGLNIKVSDGFMSVKKENFYVDGINTSLKINDVKAFRSEPVQIATINKITFNNIDISNVLVKYSIDSIRSFLIEKASCNWCGGRVSTGSIRLSPDNDDYDITLYCDRLGLSEIMRQLGFFQADGRGSLNGRIPVHYKNGKFSFDNGFLFSTPGLGGRIKLQDTKALTAGIPVNSPEFGEVDLAREALKNYKYKWAKLIFNTGKNDLLVKMEFDGAPAKVLPFEFKKKLGRFVRVGIKSPGSHFQGMKIDVNLKLPFNKVMQFGNGLRALFRINNK